MVASRAAVGVSSVCNSSQLLKHVAFEYRGRVFESRFLPKALLVFLVKDELADRVAAAISDAARTGHESGDGIVWQSAVEKVTHNRTGKRLEEVDNGV